MIPPVIVPVTFKEIATAIKYSAIGGKDIIANFEKEISAYNNCEHSIVTYSGRTALYVLLKAYGVKKGDEVIMPAYMCETVSQMLLDMGLKLNFVDVDPDTYNIDIDDLNNRISENTKAILAVHMFGNPCDMQAIMDIAQEKDAIVIEDAAQAMGAEYKGKKVGTIAESGFFSFGRGKPITAMGGGAIVTNNNNIAKKSQEIVNEFKQESSKLLTFFRLLGYSSIRSQTVYNMVYKKVRSETFRPNINLENLKCRFSTLQASIGLSQLYMLEDFNNIRKKNAELLIKELINIDEIMLPKTLNHSRPIFLRFPIKLKNSNLRNKIVLLLEKHGIETSVVYPTPLPCLFKNTQQYPGSEEVIKKVIALPTHPLMKRNNLETMINIIKTNAIGEL